MKAGVFQGVGDVQISDVAEPEAGNGDVILAVEACGICGSDLHTYEHGSFVAPGQVMGHEFAGRVVDTGGVEGVTEGERVTASPLVPCEECPRCREGRSNICPHAFTTGIAFGRPGAFAERVSIPHAQVGETLFALGDDVSAEAGATAEPLAVAVHAVKLADPSNDATAVVLGLGTIGLQVVQSLKARGVRRILGIDLSALRLEAAATLGAEALDGAGGVTEALGGALAEGDEIDVVFECSGIPDLANAALEHVRGGGTVVVLALYDDPVTLNPTVLVQKEIRLQGSIAYTGEDFRHAVELLRSGQVQVEPLITHREALEDIAGAFTTQLSKADSIKVLVTP